MKKWFCACAIAAAACMAGAARGATIANLLNDSGSLSVQTFAPPSITSATLAGPYGVPPLPTLVTIANGVAMTFTLNSDFLATANTNSGGKTTTMDGQLSFTITFASPVNLTTNLVEDGIYSVSGSGTTNVTGSVTVTNAAATESHTNSFPAPVMNASGIWSLSDQLGGFTGSYSSYTVTIDNTLIASALVNPTAGNLTGAGSAYLAKKDFTLVFTTDGGNGTGQTPSPEPASLGVLALGGVALLARRRK